MVGERRARELFSKAVYRMQTLARISSTAPANMQVQLRAYSIIWELKQEYRGEPSPAYMTKKAHKEALERVNGLGAMITEGAHKTEALEAVADAGEYLKILANNLLRDNRKTRVY